MFILFFRFLDNGPFQKRQKISKVLFLNGINLDLTDLRRSVPCGSLGINVSFVYLCSYPIYLEDCGLFVRLIDSFVKNSKFARQPDRSDSNPEIFSSEQTALSAALKVSADSITNYLPPWMKRWEVLK